MKVKNAWSKTRKQDNPYYVAVEGAWEWKILKAYKSSGNAAKDKYARVFCAVTSPHTFGSADLGDVYVRDIPGYAHMLAAQRLMDHDAQRLADYKKSHAAALPE